MFRCGITIGIKENKSKSWSLEEIILPGANLLGHVNTKLKSICLRSFWMANVKRIVGVIPNLLLNIWLVGTAGAIPRPANGRTEILLPNVKRPKP